MGFIVSIDLSSDWLSMNCGAKVMPYPALQAANENTGKFVAILSATEQAAIDRIITPYRQHKMVPFVETHKGREYEVLLGKTGDNAGNHIFNITKKRHADAFAEYQVYFPGFKEPVTTVNFDDALKLISSQLQATYHLPETGPHLVYNG